MKHIHFASSVLAVLALYFFASCAHEPYYLQSVTPHRVEITRQWDAQPVPEAVAFLKPFLFSVDSLRQPYVGRSAQSMSAGRPESLLSNWVSDALLATGERLGYQPDFAICNIGGLRASMPQDTVRRGDILAISPFENFFTILKMRGSDVESLMRDIAAVHGEGVSKGVQLKITRDGQLESAQIGGQSIQPNRVYTVITLDYLAEGNDKLYSFKNAIERETTQEPVREVLMNHLRFLDQQGQVATAEIEGRITIVEKGEAPIAVRQTEIGNAVDCIEIHPADSTAATKQLLVVHTNDTHSCIEPLNPLLADTAQADKGGYLRRAAFLRDLRASDPDLLLFDAGDFSQGSTFYSLFHGDVEVGLMNLMHYDAVTIGNHEFDFGLENMAHLFKKATFPIVCCNYDFTGTPVEGLVKPYVILQRNGLKIGVTGVGAQLEGLVAAHTCEGVTYLDPIQSVQAVADELKEKQQCDVVICLSHLGWHIEGLSDEELIPATRYIDLVIGGHSHTYFAGPQPLMNLDGLLVPDNQMGKNGRFVGTLRLNLQKQSSEHNN